jgi:hypothetical protein
MSTNIIYPIDKPWAACEENLTERIGILLRGLDVRCCFIIAKVSGGWRAFYGVHGLGVEAPGRAPQRYQSQSLQ